MAWLSRLIRLPQEYRDRIDFAIHLSQTSMRLPKSTQSIRWSELFKNPPGGKIFIDRNLNPGVSIYHYLEYPHALAIFSENRLRLTLPASWADPYERAWSGTVFKGALKKTSAYALCWSRSRFDAPAWRMVGFGRPNAIVRIRIRVRDILAAAGTFAAEQRGAFFVGKVRYEREQTLQRLGTLAHAGEMKDLARGAADLLLRKRNAFRFEREVRTLWLNPEPQNPVLFLPIDAQATVSQVMCSPHAHADERARIHNEFERFGVGVVDSPVDLEHHARST
jgi:hypothetical protein